MSTNISTKVGHLLAKGLGIKLPYRDPLGSLAEPVTRGESVFSSGTAENYIEPEPSAIEWVEDLIPTSRDVAQYFYNLFPFLRWITRYNVQWLIGDLVAGITVGAVVVPQGMSYAQLADLPVEYGLYTSFMGVLIYWFFATSKDITIGPVAVMSTLTGNIIIEVQKAHPDLDGHVIASALAVIAGAIITFIGLIRWGWIVEFIPLTAITAYMTGSALNIVVGQIKNLMGETAKFNTRGATYKTLILSLKHLPSSQLDAALGLTGLVMLYGIRYACNYAARKRPEKSKLFFFIATLRTAFVILFYTMISAATNIHRRHNPAFKVIGNVPRGFKHAGAPQIDTSIIKAFAGQLPAAIIVMLIEHISISKSFGRVNNYKIDPSQEMVAIGVTNLLGPLLGAYPATGSFSRTAIKSKAGVRTPIAGLITAVVVLLAIYALPPLFWYIPQASLSAVIIHAVGDLITPPNVVYQFWLVSPFEVFIFFAGVLVTVFASIEDGVYTTMCVSMFLLLWRLVRSQGEFLGKVRVHSVIGDHLIDDEGKYGQPGPVPERTLNEDNDQDDTFRNVYLPVTHRDGSNPQISVQHPYPGVFIYRFSDGYLYPNANNETDGLVATIFKETRRTNPHMYGSPGDRPWNDPGPRRGQSEPDRSDLPTLRAIILDFSSVHYVDVTSIQNLIDVRNQLDLYASPEPVQWHFTNINNRWTKRALTSAGFGYPTPAPNDGFKRWKPIFSVAELGGSSSAAATAERERLSHQHKTDVEQGRSPYTTEQERIETESRSSNSNDGDDYIKQINTATVSKRRNNIALVSGLGRPFFHIDVTSAVQSAIFNIEESRGALKLIEP